MRGTILFRRFTTPTRLRLPILFVGILATIGTEFNAGSSARAAQPACQTFTETGKAVCGEFLEYWQGHGGLTQQGYPISEEMMDTSETDGKVYTMQYFERAVFELHPENQAPNDVLLSLLGNFAYEAKYGAAGAPNQSPSTANATRFPQTGKTLGGRFREYWEANGGLAQQGYPISDEFQEVSALDGKTYTVQYFERAVFEMHPENQPPFDVLLSQLGTFQFKKEHLSPAPTGIAIATTTSKATPANPTPTAQPSTTPLPLTATPAPIDSCEGIPPTNPEEMQLAGTCLEMYGTMYFYGKGFGDRTVGVYATMPNGQVFGAPFHVPVNHRWETARVELTIDEKTPYYGIWTITMEGVQTGRKVYGYFKLVPQGTPMP
jgi:hypothetical protein